MESNSKLRNRMKRGKPKEMIVYLCGNCGFRFGRTEQHTPACSYCQAKSGFSIVKRQKLTPAAIAERLKESTDNMVKALMGGYQNKPKGADEKHLLKVMQKAKKFTQKVQKLKLRRPKKYLAPFHFHGKKINKQKLSKLSTTRRLVIK